MCSRTDRPRAGLWQRSKYSRRPDIEPGCVSDCRRQCLMPGGAYMSGTHLESRLERELMVLMCLMPAPMTPPPPPRDDAGDGAKRDAEQDPRDASDPECWCPDQAPGDAFPRIAPITNPTIEEMVITAPTVVMNFEEPRRRAAAAFVGPSMIHRVWPGRSAPGELLTE